MLRQHFISSIVLQFTALTRQKQIMEKKYFFFSQIRKTLFLLLILYIYHCLFSSYLPAGGFTGLTLSLGNCSREEMWKWEISLETGQRWKTFSWVTYTEHWEEWQGTESLSLWVPSHLSHVTYENLEEELMSNDHINGGVILVYLLSSPPPNANNFWIWLPV